MTDPLVNSKEVWKSRQVFRGLPRSTVDAAKRQALEPDVQVQALAHSWAGDLPSLTLSLLIYRIVHLTPGNEG